LLFDIQCRTVTDCRAYAIKRRPWRATSAARTSNAKAIGWHGKRGAFGRYCGGRDEEQTQESTDQGANWSRKGSSRRAGADAGNARSSEFGVEIGTERYPLIVQAAAKEEKEKEAPAGGMGGLFGADFAKKLAARRAKAGDN